MNVFVRHGKGGKVREVIIGPQYSEIIREQIGERQTGWLLATYRGKPIHNSQVRRTMRNLGVNAHAFRHTFARDLNEENFQVRETQYLLGHARLNTTEVYLGKLALDDNARKKMEQRP